MKVGIITTHRAINFGAVLQGFALNRSINKIPEVKCEVIDYIPNEKNFGRDITYKFDGLRNIIYSLILFGNRKYRLGHSKKVDFFDQFVDKHITKSLKNYTFTQDFHPDINSYDVLICGSDQIWNLSLIDDPIFFLHFNESIDSKKVAYAPSITQQMSKDQIKLIKERTNDFHSLSLRENESAELFSKLLGRNIKSVLDPVFLLSENEWKEIEEKPDFVKEPFILSYGLVSDPLLKDSINYVKKELNIKHIDIQVRPFNKYNANICTNKLSPSNFVWLFRNADFICTSSFHGTCFAILFNKNFVTVPSKDRSLRIENILNITKLKSRQIKSKEQLKSGIIKNIKYEEVNDLLDKQINYSTNYLTNSISFENI